jgi:hypothetical protein
MIDKNLLDKEFDKSKEEILKELQEGKDVMIKNTGKGLKVQSLQVKTLGR